MLEEAPRCNCPAGGSSDDCVNRQLFQECDMAHPNCGNTCIQRRAFPRIEVFFAGYSRGWALRVAWLMPAAFPSAAVYVRHTCDAGEFSNGGTAASCTTASTL